MLRSVCLECHVFQEEDKRQLRETSMHPLNSERYVHTFKDITNFSGTINVTYRYLAGTPLPRKSKTAFAFFILVLATYTCCQRFLNKL